MIKYEIIRDQGIVIIEPLSALQKKDFEDLTKAIDEYIKEHGTVNGIMIHAKSFPGWENFGAFVHHIRFVKNHHKKVKRIAVLTDSKFLTVMPGIAKLFVSPEIKHFGYGQMDDAKKWIAERQAM
jgi:hypothetical protein